MQENLFFTRFVRLYVTNLPSAKIQKDDLKTALYMLFSTYGPVLDVVALKTMKMRGQAHIVFRDMQAATQAMRALEGFSFLGRELVRSRIVCYFFCQASILTRAFRGFPTPSPSQTQWQSSTGHTNCLALPLPMSRCPKSNRVSSTLPLQDPLLPQRPHRPLACPQNLLLLSPQKTHLRLSRGDKSAHGMRKKRRTATLTLPWRRIATTSELARIYDTHKKTMAITMNLDNTAEKSPGRSRGYAYYESWVGGSVLVAESHFFWNP